MFKTLTIASVIALSAAAPGFAGSLAEPAVTPEPMVPVVPVLSTDWTGFYVGAQGLAGLGDHSTLGSYSFWGLGGQAGYLSDMGSFVIGGEVNFEYDSADTFADPIYRAGADLIAGYDAGDFLPHVTLGGALIKSDAFGPDWYPGVAAGAGVSFMATDSVMLTGRYQFSYYPDVNTDTLSTHAFKAMVSMRF